MTCCQQRAFFFLLRTALKPLNWIWRKLIERKISMSSTKFVFFGAIRKPRCDNKCGTLYSGARCVALWASCLYFISRAILSTLEYIFYTGTYDIGRWKGTEEEPLRSETFTGTRYQYYWYKPLTEREEKRLVVNSSPLFIPGYTAIEKYINGDDVIASQVPAFEALEQFWQKKGKLISFVVLTLAYFKRLFHF